MDSKPKAKPPPQPRLGRLNANKNIDYEAVPSAPSTPILLGNQTSFRIGGEDGEIDRICWSLGLSGPDDFSIPFAAWEARKARSNVFLSPTTSNSNSIEEDAEDLLSPLDRAIIKKEELIYKSGREQRADSYVLSPFDGAITVEQLIPNSILSSFMNNSGREQVEEIISEQPSSTCYIQPEVVLLSPMNKSGREQVEEVITEEPTADSMNNSGREKGEEVITEQPIPDSMNNSGREQGEEVIIEEPIPDSERLGINGVRPPMLASTPLENEVVLEVSPSSVSTSSSSSDKQVHGIGETTLLSDSSCSYSTSNDDDDDDGGSDGGDGGVVELTTNVQHLYIISPNVSFRRNIKSWTKGVLLGSGSFGMVYEGFSDDGFFFAVKEVSLVDQGNQAKQSISQLEQEISLLSQFEHKNIVQYLGTDKDEEKLYIFLELVTKGSLAQLYHKYDLHDSQVSAYTRQILHGLMYLHERNVVHRDIKCANILVDVKGYVKLADFGLAKATKFNDVKSCKGTALWMAPEVVNRKSRGYGLAADIWSLGCTVLEMLTRQLPYSHLESMQALFRIGRGEPPPVSKSLSAVARDFIHQCLQVNADNRPTAAQLLEHPFVNRPLSASSGFGSPSQPDWRRS